LNVVDFTNRYNRHDNRLILAENEKNDVKTLTIFQDEIENKFDIVTRRLLNILGLNTSSIYARKTKVVKLDRLTKDTFFKKYHIQGTDISMDYYGLDYNGEIVSAITFKKGKTDDVIEMNRFASSMNVVGGFTKLLNHYVKEHNPSTIVTFADMRWTPNLENSVYKKMGFTHVETQPPVYHYVKDGQRFNRQQFMKHKILERHPELDGNLTEHQLTTQLGYKRVYDCGNFKFEKVYGEVVESEVVNIEKKSNNRYEQIDTQVSVLIEKGYNKKQICDELGKSKNYINECFERLGFERKSIGFTDDEKQLIKKLHEDGKVVADIEEELVSIGVSIVNTRKIISFLYSIGLKVNVVKKPTIEPIVASKVVDSELKDEQKSKITELYKSGLGLKLIEKKMSELYTTKITRYKIRNYLERVGLKEKK
jgi:hypothetical protein